jgi:very-short-patch-repair endonuclease
MKSCILDFYCHQALLAIEIDDEIHLREDNLEHDKYRTQELEAMGVSVIRFTNDEVLGNINLVLERIKKALKRDIEA